MPVGIVMGFSLGLSLGLRFGVLVECVNLPSFVADVESGVLGCSTGSSPSMVSLEGVPFCGISVASVCCSLGAMFLWGKREGAWRDGVSWRGLVVGVAVVCVGCDGSWGLVRRDVLACVSMVWEVDS